MPTESMLPKAVSLALRRAVSRWSDAQRGRAEALADKHRELRHGKYPQLSNAQLSGVMANLTSADTWVNQKHFVRHQREKAEKAERKDMVAFWADLEQAGDSLLQKDAKEIWAQSLAAAGEAGKALNPNKPPEMVHQLLLREFAQHLVAHSLYLAAQE